MFDIHIVKLEDNALPQKTNFLPFQYKYFGIGIFKIHLI